VYPGVGAVLHRGSTGKGESKGTPLKLPKVVGHVALMRHFRECISGSAAPAIGGKEGVVLMQMIEGIYKSAETGKGAQI
jgi:predicted dehydrogenase